METSLSAKKCTRLFLTLLTTVDLVFQKKGSLFFILRCFLPPLTSARQT